MATMMWAKRLGGVGNGVGDGVGDDGDGLGWSRLIFHRRDFSPIPIESFLPKAHFVVALRDGENIAHHRPTHAPNLMFERQPFANLPYSILRFCPDNTTLVLNTDRQ